MIKQPNSRNCFVCGLENTYGLKLHFYETNPGEVTVKCTVPNHYQSYPGIVHGGIVSTILDETLGRAHINADSENTRFMYTARVTVRYRKPVPTGKPLVVVGRAVKSKKRMATSTATIYGPDGDILAEAEGLLVDVPTELYKGGDIDALGWKVYPDSAPLAGS